ncbi:branched-chain amino acid ABC transporter permease [Pseudovibrio sp. Tun.PSC04-5.I4]|uniref:branched-chain amino acid ABC transporter permease n=1 Tax=Pseudovibrio sp. Tun.PSC04-5.I4 TaxID=1798213 RepID=UPI0008914C21|nr:branched-chain amino acid ABC transporter permease [Pseudovibrio sp. Tun.PSC04-5.I4]SDQ21428.1 branched-chain amino acid transport system permease protein [Pseudovibrio sp. Tun.PSC04-5.I4]
MELAGLFFYFVSFLTMAGIYAVICLALNIQWGFGGLFNAGIAGFYAIGAYSAAIVTSTATSNHVGGFQQPIFVGMAVAAVIAGLVGWGIARLCVSLKSDYLAMATIGIAEIIRLVIVNEEWLTNGSLGVSNIPRPFEGMFKGQTAAIVFVLFVWMIVLLTYFVSHRLHQSPWGRVLRAIRDNEDAAASIGKDVQSFRTQTFVIGAIFMALAGALSAHYFKYFSPDATEPILITFLAWVMLIAGGSGNNKGAIAGALIVWAIWSMTEILTGFLPSEWATRSSYMRMLMIGLFLQFVLQRYRSGLIPEKAPKLDLG